MQQKAPLTVWSVMFHATGDEASVGSEVEAPVEFEYDTTWAIIRG